MNPRRQKRKNSKANAVRADVSKQVPINTYGPPKTHYYDVRFTCIDCSKDQVWTAEDQKWFYEVAKGSLHATATRCRDCRKLLRAKKDLQQQQMNDSRNNKRDT